MPERPDAMEQADIQRLNMMNISKRLSSAENVPDLYPGICLHDLIIK